VGRRGNVFLVGAAIKNPPKIDYVGTAVYKSTDGGQHLTRPTSFTPAPGMRSSGPPADGSAAFHGRVYIVWTTAQLRFARTLDHGNTWIGAGNDPAGSILAPTPSRPRSMSAPTAISASSEARSPATRSR
jgi:hypothetical protein